jgi:PWI domain
MEDSRAYDKILRTTKFPSIFYNTTTIDISKVNKAIVCLWIDNEITSLLGFEDEIVSNTAMNLFCLTDEQLNVESATTGPPVVDPRNAHIVLSGFLGDDASLQFCTKLWELIIDAAQQPMGIPRQLIEEKKRQLMVKAAATNTSAASIVAIPTVPSIASLSTSNQPSTAVVRPQLPSQQDSQPNNRKGRNRWDNREGQWQEELDVKEEAQQPRIHNLIDNDNIARTIDTKDYIDEYGRRHRAEERKNRSSVHATEPIVTTRTAAARDRLPHPEHSRNRDRDGTMDADKEKVEDEFSRRRDRRRHHRHSADDHEERSHRRHHERDDRDYKKRRHEDGHRARRYDDDDDDQHERSSSHHSHHHRRQSDHERVQKRRHRHDRSQSPPGRNRERSDRRGHS